MGEADTDKRVEQGSPSGRIERPEVALFEDRRAVAEALKLVFEQQDVATVTIVAEGDAVDPRLLDNMSVVVMDISKADAGELDLASKLLRERPQTTLLGVSTSGDDDTISELRSRGFSGLVRKDASLADLAAAVTVLAAGGSAFPQDERSRKAVDDPFGNAAHALLLARQLTLREHEVLTMLVDGASSGEVADELGIRANTVRTHIQNIMTKLQVHSRLQAVMFAVRYGLVKVSDDPGPG